MIIYIYTKLKNFDLVESKIFTSKDLLKSYIDSAVKELYDKYDHATKYNTGYAQPSVNIDDDFDVKHILGISWANNSFSIYVSKCNFTPVNYNEYSKVPSDTKLPDDPGGFDLQDNPIRVSFLESNPFDVKDFEDLTDVQKHGLVVARVRRNNNYFLTLPNGDLYNQADCLNTLTKKEPKHIYDFIINRELFWLESLLSYE